MSKNGKRRCALIAAVCLAGIGGCEQERHDFAGVVNGPPAAGGAVLSELSKLALPTSSRHETPRRATSSALDTASVRAVAVLKPTQGSSAVGEIAFLQEGARTHITGFIGNLPPGPHGFHIHEYGDCTAPDASSAGAHFSTAPNQKHGPPSAPVGERHAGDLGNIVADANGVAEIAIEDSDLQLLGDTGALGRAVIVHMKADDLTSQPSGDAGDRLACGVIVQRDALALSTRM